eukprot:COSAG03_NODE_23678_length_278_cov_0.569832_2_plen_58_part_01
MALVGVASLLSLAASSSSDDPADQPSLARSGVAVACSSQDYHCADCLATNDTRPVWAS